jgi:hypothetical protein
MLRTLLLVIFAAIVVVAAVWYNDRTVFFAAPSFSPAWRVLLLVVAMLIGIVFGHLHDTFLNQASEPLVWSVVVNAMRSGALWASLLASPIIFGIVYVASSGVPDLVTAAVFSFENGFFCRMVLQRRRERF